MDMDFPFRILFFFCYGPATQCGDFTGKPLLAFSSPHPDLIKFGSLPLLRGKFTTFAGGREASFRVAGRP